MGKISNTLSFVNVFNILKILGSKTGTTAERVVNCFATVMKLDPSLLCGKIEKQLRLGVNGNIFQYTDGLYRIKPYDEDEPRGSRSLSSISSSDSHNERGVREVDRLVVKRNNLTRSRNSALQRKADIMEGLSNHYNILKGLNNHFKNCGRKQKAPPRRVTSKPRPTQRKTMSSNQQLCQCSCRICKPKDSKLKASPRRKQTLNDKANSVKPTKKNDFPPSKKLKFDDDFQKIFNRNLKIDFSIKSPKQHASQQPRKPENTFNFNGGNGLNNSNFGQLCSPEKNSTSHRKKDRPTSDGGKQAQLATQGKSRQPKGMAFLKVLGLDTLVKVVDNPLKKRRRVKSRDENN